MSISESFHWPSMSRPNDVSIVAAVPLRSNGYVVPMPLDNAPIRASEAGRSVSFVRRTIAMLVPERNFASPDPHADVRRHVRHVVLPPRVRFTRGVRALATPSSPHASR